MKTRQFDAVVFDMDGVIFDSERAVMDCWTTLAEKYNIKDIEQSVLACTGTTMVRTREIMLERYGDDFPYDDYAHEASIMYHKRYDGGRLPMKKGVAELLGFLKKNGKKIALASSTRRQTVENQLREAEIYDYFDGIVCGDMVSRSKPAPDIFLLAAQQIGCEPENCYVFEDGTNGIRAGAAAGCTTIMIPDLTPPNAQLEQLCAGIYPSLSDAMNAIADNEI